MELSEQQENCKADRQHQGVAANKLKRSKCEWESLEHTKLESGVIQQDKVALNVKMLAELG